MAYENNYPQGNYGNANGQGNMRKGNRNTNRGGIKYIRYVNSEGQKIYLKTFDEVRNFTGLVEVGIGFDWGSIILTGLLDRCVFLPRSMVTNASENTNVGGNKN